MNARLDRTTFSTSRLLDFCSRKELIAQTGYNTIAWPEVVLKELVDNALDACEEIGVAPEITIRVDDAGITVIDNGPGIPATTVAGVLDFSRRVSSREAYVAPDRGAQGNALMTMLEEHGVAKVIPEEDCLASAYRRGAEQAFVQQKIDEVIDEVRELGEGTEIPNDLRAMVEERLQEDRTAPWDSVVRDIAISDLEDGADA